MRIAVNTRFLQPGNLEGVGYYTREICRRLPDLLPQAEFLFCFDRPFSPEYVAHPRVHGVQIFPPARDPVLWRYWFDFCLPRRVRRWRADVLLHFDGFCSLNTRVPQVVVTHDIAHYHYPEAVPGRVQRYYEKYVPQFLDKAKKNITVSEFVREDIGRVYGLDPQAIGLAGNGVRDTFHPVAAERRESIRNTYTGGRPYFFYLGAVHPRKNIVRLIEAYDRYRTNTADGIPLLLGGRLAWQLEEVRAAHRRSAFQHDILFLGYVAEAEINDLLGSAVALVYPSLSEGFGVPLLEAMHAEVPILTSNRTSLPEVAADAALYIDPEDVASIADGLSTIAGDAVLRERLVAAGRQRREHYNWDAAAETVASALRDVYQSEAINSRPPNNL